MAISVLSPFIFGVSFTADLLKPVYPATAETLSPFSCDTCSLLCAGSRVVVLQVPGSSPAARSVHLLLAVFREVTTLYGVSDSNRRAKRQVRYFTLEACDKHASLIRMNDI